MVGMMNAVTYIMEFEWKTVAILFLVEIGRIIMLTYPGWLCRHFIMKNYLHFEKDDIEKIESLRRLHTVHPNAWTLQTTTRLCEKYGEQNIKCLDTLSRKVMGHIAKGIYMVIMFTIIGSASINAYIIYYSLYLPIWILWYETLIRYFPKNKFFLIITFGASARIRDGYLAYRNRFYAMICDCLGGIIGPVIIIAVYANPNVKTQEYLLLAYLSSAAIIFGDAAGELIGSPFGRHQFNVKGMGEINKKSIEGCIAVFVFSFIPSIIIVAVNSRFNHLMWLYWSPLIAALLTTIAETISFRSTDNLTIMVANATFYAVLFRLKKL